MRTKLLVLAGFLIFVTALHAQTIQSFFDKYADDERFEYVSVGNGMTNLVSVFGGRAKNEQQMMAKMKKIRILSLQTASGSALMKTFENDLQQVLSVGKFETAVEVRDKGDKVHIYYQVSGKDNADMLIVTKEKNEMSIIWINGKMNKQELMKTFSSQNIHGHAVVATCFAPDFLD